MSRNAYPLNAVGQSRVVASGRFRPNGSSAISNALNKGKGWTVVRTLTGVYTVTIAGAPFGQLDDVIAQLMLGTAGDQFCIGGAVDAAAGTIVINAWDISGAAVADVASNADNWIAFSCTIRNSSEEN